MSTKDESLFILGAVGLLDLLFVAFVILRIAKVITWSWWWVTAPFWGQFVLVFIITIIALVVVGVDKIRGRK